MWIPHKNNNKGKDGELALECRPNMSFQRSNSPPLEGGESLCEFYINVRKEKDSALNTERKQVRGNLNQRISGNVQHKSSTNSPLNEVCGLNDNLFLLFDHDLPSNSFTKTFLQSILASVDSQDPIVANAWMETLLDITDLLPENVIKEEILSWALSKGQISQSESSHLLSCRILGKLSTKLDPYLIKKEVLPVVHSFCQDGDCSVRICVCQHLPNVAKGLNLETIKSAILPELVELSNDSEPTVRLTVIETVVEMLPLLDNETSSQIIVPLVQKLCKNSIKSDEPNLPCVSEKIGKLALGLYNILNVQQKSWFLDYFRNLAKLGLPHCQSNTEESTNFYYSPMPDLVPELESKDRHGQCRWSCAFNFPAMVLFAGTENFEEKLKDTFSELCCDPVLNVRKTTASGFYEVVKVLGLHSSMLLPDLICLLNDDSLEVLKCLIPNIADTLKLICQRQNDQFLLENSNRLVKALINSLEVTAFSSNWRHHSDLLTQMSCLPQCIPSDIIYTTFVPMLFVKLHTCRPLPCRIAAARSLLVLLRNSNRLEDRNGIINELIRELCKGRSCYKRMLFIKVCKLVTELFSKAFFKRHFFVPVLTLSDDPVPNVRLQLCAIFPKLKSLLKIPKDVSLLEKLELCLKNLMSTEKDRDVCEAITKAIGELDKIEVPTESIPRAVSTRLETDLDKLKEDEENFMLELELKNNFVQTKANFSSNFVTRSLTRQGKIPIRKNSSTLPKITRLKSQRSFTLNRLSSKKIVEQYEKETCDPSIGKIEQNVHSMSELGSSINKAQTCTNPNRCPSPRPKQKQFSGTKPPEKDEQKIKNSHLQDSIQPATITEKERKQYSHSPSYSRIPTPKPR